MCESDVEVDYRLIDSSLAAAVRVMANRFRYFRSTPGSANGRGRDVRDLHVMDAPR